MASVLTGIINYSSYIYIYLHIYYMCVSSVLQRELLVRRLVPVLLHGVSMCSCRVLQVVLAHDHGEPHQQQGLGESSGSVATQVLETMAVSAQRQVDSLQKEMERMEQKAEIYRKRSDFSGPFNSSCCQFIYIIILNFISGLYRLIYIYIYLSIWTFYFVLP